jgi:hypothetical protein
MIYNQELYVCILKTKCIVSFIKDVFNLQVESGIALSVSMNVSYLIVTKFIFSLSII